MLRIAICDDEAPELSQIMQIVEDYREGHPYQDVSVMAFQSSEELLESREKNQFHIYLLDILMGKQNGISVGQAIRDADEMAVIIYLTVSPDYAVESYAVRAYYYLLKPVTRENLFPILERAIGELEDKENIYVAVRTKNGIQSLRRSQIMYVEYHYHILSYYLTSGEVVESLTVRANFEQEAEPLLKDGQFVRISSSFLVNLDQVQRVGKKGFCMKNGVELTVTRTYTEARRRYLEYVLRDTKGPSSN